MADTSYLFWYKAQVINVVDGDTFDAIVDLGFGIMQKLRFRMIGINTPEKFGETKEAGLLAKAELTRLIEGKSVDLNTVLDKSEKFGRYLAQVWLSEPELNVNQHMVANGFVVEYNGGKR